MNSNKLAQKNEHLLDQEKFNAGGSFVEIGKNRQTMENKQLIVKVLITPIWTAS